MFAQKPGKGITLEMYIRNTQVNKKKKERKETVFITYNVKENHFCILLSYTRESVKSVTHITELYHFECSLYCKYLHNEKYKGLN